MTEKFHAVRKMTDQELDQEALFGCMTSLMNVKQWMIRYSGVMKCCHSTFDDIKVEQKNSSRRRIYKSKWAVGHRFFLCCHIFFFLLEISMYIVKLY